MKPIKTILIVFIIASLATGCVSYKRCYKKFSNSTDSVSLIVPVMVPVTLSVPVPPDRVDFTYHYSGLDSLLKTTDSLVLISQAGRARLSIIMDRNDSLLSIECECLPDTITVIDTLTVDAELTVPLANNFERPRGFVHWVGVISILAICVVVVLGIIKYVLPKIMIG
jgi:hypothetical protein